MLELAQTVASPIMLVNGDPNFRTPDHIVESAAEAAFQGATGYAPGAGVQELRDAVADKVTTRNGLRASSDEVCITTGACGGLYTSLMLTVGPGDEVLVPDPGWSNYAAMVHVLGANLSPYPVGPTEHWELDPAAVEARVNERTRLILVNSPANPSGVVESRARLPRSSRWQSATTFGCSRTRLTTSSSSTATRRPPAPGWTRNVSSACSASRRPTR